MRKFTTKPKPYNLQRTILAHNKQMQGITLHANHHKKRCKDYEKLDRTREEFCVVMNVVLGDYSRLQAELGLDQNAQIALQQLRKIDVEDMKTHFDISNLGQLFRTIPNGFVDDVGQCIQQTFAELSRADNLLRHNAYKTIYDQENYKEIAKMFFCSFTILKRITGVASFTSFKNKKFIAKRIKKMSKEIEKL